MDGGNPALRAWLHETIRSRGPMTFAQFMNAALYHPLHGYYCRPGATTGRSGDFYTSPDVHPAFGRLVSRQVAEIAEKTGAGEEGPFGIIEAGPGTGTLARDIIAALASERPELARRATYMLVEISPEMQAIQRATLDAAGSKEKVNLIEWISWAGLLERRGGTGFAGCIVANEFLDALPVHIVELRGGKLLEIHVSSDGERFGEVLLEPSTYRLERHLGDLESEDGVVLEDGQRAEIGLRALDWISSLGRLFGERGRGGAVLIDYGYPASELYDPARHRGTLMCYYRHQACEDPFVHVGEQDLTAHVDFSSVSRAARVAGFDVAGPITQMKFLVAHGLAGILADLASLPEPGLRHVEERLALHGLMAPGGMGEIFKVLLLSRGTAAPELAGAKDPFRG